VLCNLHELSLKLEISFATAHWTETRAFICLIAAGDGAAAGHCTAGSHRRGSRHIQQRRRQNSNRNSHHEHRRQPSKWRSQLEGCAAVTAIIGAWHNNCGRLSTPKLRTAASCLWHQ